MLIGSSDDASTQTYRQLVVIRDNYKKLPTKLKADYFKILSKMIIDGLIHELSNHLDLVIKVYNQLKMKPIIAVRNSSTFKKSSIFTK